MLTANEHDIKYAVAAMLFNMKIELEGKVVQYLSQVSQQAWLIVQYSLDWFTLSTSWY